MKTYFGLVDGQEIPSHYDYYIWSSERCLEGIKWCKENHKDYEIIPKNWGTEEEIYECIDYLETVKEKILEYAADLLNEYHALHYDRKQWNIFLGKWLCNYLTSYYDKFLKIRWIIDHDVECECNIYTDSMVNPALDYSDYAALLSLTDDYHLYQYSQLLKLYHSNSRISVIEGKHYKKPKPEIKKTSFKAEVFRRAIDVLRIFKKRDAVIIYDSYWPRKFLMRVMIKNLGKIYDYRYYYLYNFRRKVPQHMDDGWRTKELTITGGRDEFTEIMKLFLKRELPVSSVENFCLLKKKSQKVYGKDSAPKAVIYPDSGVSMDELFKVYLMDIKGKNTLLCGIQHGGGYGINNASWEVRTEINMSDRFYTWGWTGKHIHSELKSMPMVKMVGHRFIPPKKNMDILYVSYRAPKNIFIIQKDYLWLDEYIQGEEQFIRLLDRECLCRLRLRPNAVEYGWKTYHPYHRIRENIPELRFDNISDFYTSLDSSKLVVVGMWYTTVLEALSVDRAILIKHDMQGIRPEAQDDLKEMERVGILCRTFEELAERLNQIYDNVEEWWNEPDRQGVVRRIRERYAWTCPDAEERWMKEIESLYNDIPS